METEGDQQNKHSLKKLVPHDGSVGLRVDGVDHEVGLGVILLGVSIPKPPCPDGFHHHRCPWNLVLDVALQDPKGKTELESCSG